MRLPYFVRSGKNVKAIYFAAAILRDIMPTRKPHDVREFLLRKVDQRPDKYELARRLDYYCRSVFVKGPMTRRVCDIKRSDQQSTYYFDLKEAVRMFDSRSEINFLPGDITFVPEYPSLTKSRPIHGDNTNSVLLPLDRIRHFIWHEDVLDWSQKDAIVIFRGKVPGKEKRVSFFTKWYGTEGIDIADSSRHGNPHWRAPRKLSLDEQLRHRYILALEGNDVASNLKWVMNSNSVAVMPEPEYETWFMEGCLEPWRHYVPISRDYNDLKDVIERLESSPSLAQDIIGEAHAYTAKFKDRKRERLLAALVVARYLGFITESDLS